MIYTLDCLPLPGAGSGNHPELPRFNSRTHPASCALCIATMWRGCSPKDKVLYTAEAQLWNTACDHCW